MTKKLSTRKVANVIRGIKRRYMELLDYQRDIYLLVCLVRVG